jgi:HSP20 family protein
MSLVPFRRNRAVTVRDPIMQIQEDMNRLFAHLVDGFGMRDVFAEPTFFAPALDVTEDEQAYRLQVDLPGVERGDITLTYEDGVLRITGEKRAERRGDGERAFNLERFYGRFYREIPLPADADGEHLKAELRRGVLTITVPKKAGANRRSIPIEGE